MKPSNKSTLTAAHERERDAIEESAAAWLARREAGLSEAEQAAFTHWLEADPRHAAVVRELTAAWSFLQKPRFTGQAGEVMRGLAAHERRQRRVQRRRRIGFSLAGLAAAGLVLGLFWPGAGGPRFPSAAGEHSIVTKPERQVLADGSVVDFNAGAELLVDFSRQQRTVRLVKGEAHFQVAKEALRPFVVQAGAVSVRAVGTEFAVRLAPEEVGVLVTEGRVTVEAVSSVAAPAKAPVYLDAGVRATVRAMSAETEPIQIEVVPNEVMSQALAWRTMRVEFANTPLAEAVRLFNQSNRLQLELADRATAQIRISGIFWANDPEGFVRLLESGAEVKATRSGDDHIVMSREP